MRRRPGIGGLQTHAAARDQFRLLGENVAKIRTDMMKEQLATFRSQLEDFARKHKVRLSFFLDFIVKSGNHVCGAIKIWFLMLGCWKNLIGFPKLNVTCAKGVFFFFFFVFFGTWAW